MHQQQYKGNLLWILPVQCKSYSSKAVPPSHCSHITCYTDIRGHWLDQNSANTEQVHRHKNFHQNSTDIIDEITLNSRHTALNNTRQQRNAPQPHSNQSFLRDYAQYQLYIQSKTVWKRPGKKPFLVPDSSLPPDSCSLLAALFCLKGSFIFF